MKNNLKKSQRLTTFKETKDWLDEMQIKGYSIREDLLVNVVGDVELSQKQLTSIPVEFNHVAGIFDCSENFLTTLKGCPKTLNDTFDCSHNLLTSLHFAPTVAPKSFYCANNRLTSLEGVPKNIGETFHCPNNLLNSLWGGPEIVGEYYRCTGNPIMTLDFLPEQVGAHFSIDNIDIIKNIAPIQKFLSIPHVRTKGDEKLIDVYIMFDIFKASLKAYHLSENLEMTLEGKNNNTRKVKI